MQSLNIEFLFDKTYDFFLSIRYFYYFKIKDYTPERYLSELPVGEYDGLRDRGWLEKNIDTNVFNFVTNIFSKSKPIIKDEYLNSQYKVLPDFVNPMNIGKISISYEDTVNFFYKDLDIWDKIKFALGITPNDMDSDGLPDSYEVKYNLNAFSPDTDMDGIPDGVEIFMGSDPYDFYNYPLSLQEYIRTQSDIDYINQNQIIVYPPFRDVQLKIQNPILATITEMYIVFAIFIVPIFIFLFLKWWWQVMGMFDHYYHLFHNAIGWEDKYDSSPLYKKLKKLFGKEDVHHDNHHNNNHNIDNIQSQHHNISLKDLDFTDNDIQNIIPDSDVSNSNNSTSDNTIKKSLTDKEYEMSLRWKEVCQYMSEKGEVFWRIAIIEADNILDDLLRDRGYYGKDVASKLKSASFASLDNAWTAHKIRNKIAHSNSMSGLSEREAREAINNYRIVFEDFGIIS